MIKDNKLAVEIAAEVELTIDDRATQVAKRLNKSQSLISQLVKSGMIKKIVLESRELDIAGISSGTATVDAFHGILYGIATVGCQMKLVDKAIKRNSHYSRVITGDMDFLGVSDRLFWKKYINTLDLIEEILKQAKENWPEMIIVDIPLFILRGQMLLGADTSQEVIDEWSHLEDRIKIFWQEIGKSIYPFDKGGPILVSLRPRINGGLIWVLKEKGPSAVADNIDEKLMELILKNIGEIKAYGSGRILSNMLDSKTRTMGYSLNALAIDVRAEPKELFQRGVISFLMKSTLKSSIWQIEIAGSTSDWSSEMIDQVACMLASAVLIDHRDTLPVPLWFSKKESIFPKKVLEYLRREVGTRLNILNKEEH